MLHLYSISSCIILQMWPSVLERIVQDAVDDVHDPERVRARLAKLEEECIADA